MIFPIEHAVVRFPNGDSFHATQPVEHLYNLHLELYEAYPLLPRGGIHLRLLEENEEEETVVFELCMDDRHLVISVLLAELGEVAIFDVSFSWWLREDDEEWEEPCDSWTVGVAVDLDALTWVSTVGAVSVAGTESAASTASAAGKWIPAAYGRYAPEKNAVVRWDNDLSVVLNATNPYSVGCVAKASHELLECLNAIVEPPAAAVEDM